MNRARESGENRWRGGRPLILILAVDRMIAIHAMTPRRRVHELVPREWDSP